jgi:hypothetical protein
MCVSGDGLEEEEGRDEKDQSSFLPPFALLLA